ncbi:MAG TPA: protein tyrosine phosphatase family protein [Burkholderiales bacterium]|nr:protein tyrosine phosphatase family protein [Burkholderiales bacterium]
MKAALALAAGIVLGAVLYAYAPDLLLKTGSAEPPHNFIAITDRLHTSGQPSEAQLKGLARSGYGLVVNLAPPTTTGSLPNEGALVAGNGIAYVNIPVDWDKPRYEDFVLFSDVLRRAGERRVLVHCQMNFRASTFTFLYRVVHQGVDPALAYDQVTAVWAPHDRWKAFAREVLAGHRIDFEPY